MGPAAELLTVTIVTFYYSLQLREEITETSAALGLNSHTQTGSLNATAKWLRVFSQQRPAPLGSWTVPRETPLGAEIPAPLI